MTASPPVKVLIVDDQVLVRGGIRLLLERHADIEVVGEAVDGSEAVALAREQRADVVVMDVRMPGMDGVEATRQLVERGQDADWLVKVLVLTTFDDDVVVYDALRAGAHGFLVKHTAPRKLHEAIVTIAAGDAWIDPSVTTSVLRALRAAPRTAGLSAELVSRLTPRERQILAIMATGLSNAEISARFVLSEATVRTHVTRILMKTGARDRTQAVVLAYESGFVMPPAPAG